MNFHHPSSASSGSVPVEDASELRRINQLNASWQAEQELREQAQWLAQLPQKTPFWSRVKDTLLSRS